MEANRFYLNSLGKSLGHRVSVIYFDVEMSIQTLKLSIDKVADIFVFFVYRQARNSAPDVIS